MSSEDQPERDGMEDEDGLFDAPMTRRHALRLGLTSGLALGAAGLAAGPGFGKTKPKPLPPYNYNALIAAAKQEGQLTFYSAMPPRAISRLTAGFTAQYGIKVNALRVVSAPQAALIVAEAHGSKVADVVQMSDYFFMIGAAHNGWYRVPPANLPSLKGFPASYERGTIKGQSVHDHTVYLQSLSPYTIGYNTQIVQGADIPTTWAHLVDPKWNGKIGTTDPRANNNVLSFMYMLWKKYGDAYMKQLGAQNLKLSASSVTGINSVASGDLAMFTPTNLWTDIDVEEKGAPVADAAPAPTPTTGAEEWMAMINGSPHPNAALLFFSYAMSGAGQVATCSNLCISVRSSPTTLPYPPDYMSPPINRAVQNRKTILGFLNLA
jgi:iron(III) transport system substrate-binding protein